MPASADIAFSTQPFLLTMTDKKIRNEPGPDYRLIGVATSLKEYRLCFHLNQILGCDFMKLEPLVFQPKDRTRHSSFSVFKSIETEDKHTFAVFTNKYQGEFLLTELSNFDYLIQVPANIPDQEMDDIIQAIKGFPEVMMSAEIPVKKLKHKDRLVCEEEKPVRRPIMTRKN
jgi:hypothetical protein